MTTSTDYPFRSGQVRRAGVLMRLPRVGISAVVWLLVIEALPGPAAWGVLALIVVGMIAGVVAEPVIVRLVWWARRPSTPLAVPGDPGVRFWVAGRQAAGIGQAGRRHLIVPATWIGRTDLPALLTRARQRQLVSAGRFDVAYQWFTWPWQLLAAPSGRVRPRHDLVAADRVRLADSLGCRRHRPLADRRRRPACGNGGDRRGDRADVPAAVDACTP